MKNQKIWIIYKHTLVVAGPDYGKSYIGLTCWEPEIRWHQNGTGYKRCPLFWAAIVYYGGPEMWNINWKHEIIEDNIKSLEEANIREKYWISYYHTWVKDEQCWGYNYTQGGDGQEGRPVSLETRKKISLVQIGKKRGPCSEARKAKISAALKGRPSNNKGKSMSEEQKAKISKAHIGICPSKETIEKLRCSHLGIPNKNKIKIYCVELNVVYNSIVEAAKMLNISSQNIVSVLKGRRLTAGGYHWQYVNK